MPFFIGPAMGGGTFFMLLLCYGCYAPFVIPLFTYKGYKTVNMLFPLLVAILFMLISIFTLSLITMLVAVAGLLSTIILMVASVKHKKA